MSKFSIPLAAGLALLAGAPMALAQADAHPGHHSDNAVQTTPADGAMGSTPADFSVTFPHPMRLTSLVVTRQGGDPLAVDLPAIDAAVTVTVPLSALSPGNYTIAWTATGVDNHVMNGIVRYMVH